MTLRSALCAWIVAASSLASATPADDAAYAVQEHVDSKAQGWVVERMMTLNLAPKCWETMLDKKTRGVDFISTSAFNLIRYAKAVTGDDWRALETQSGASREKNREIVDGMINDFKPKLHVTFNLDGDTCDLTGTPIWIKYLTSTTGSLSKYPPKSGVAHVTINAKAKVKKMSIEVSKDGKELTITGPRDLEVTGWSDDIERALKRVSTKN